MQIIQLYIQGTKVDMFDDESVSITQTIKNTKDISQVFTEFTQTFNLPASPTNNKLFKHYYNFDIVGGFDARARVEAEIELNYIPFQKGYIKLEGVNLKDNKAHTYKITFFGNTLSLKNLFGEDKLSALTWLDNFNQKDAGGGYLTYNDVDLKTFLTTPTDRTVNSVVYDNPIQVPLITHSQRLYYNSALPGQLDGNLYADGLQGVKYNELKYAIRLPIILRAIEEQYGINFSQDFFSGSTPAFYDLYMWLHRKKGSIEAPSQIEAQELQVQFPISSNPVSSSDGNNIIINDYAENNPAQTVVTFTPASGYLTTPYGYTIFKNGSEFLTASNVQGVQTESWYWDAGDSYTVVVYISQAITFSSVTFFVEGIFNQTTYSQTYNSGTFSSTGNVAFLIRQQIPEMKVIDFVSGLFKMFNLVAYIENGLIVCKTLDSYYAAGNTYDVSKYVEVDSSEVNVALPYREVVYKYKGTKSYLSNIHAQLIGKEWGTIEYRGDSNTRFSGEIFNYEVPFEHFKFERLFDVGLGTPAPITVQWGYSVDDNQQPYIGAPFIFYLKHYENGTNINYVNTVDSNGVPTVVTSINDYFLPLNSRLGDTTSQTINFFAEQDEWALAINDQSLFQNYHRNYIASIFNQSNRMTTVTAYLPQSILINFQLNDTFVINNIEYKINSIKTNLLTGKSDIELLNVF
jgi:hypothetical protein